MSIRSSTWQLWAAVCPADGCMASAKRRGTVVLYCLLNCAVLHIKVHNLPTAVRGIDGKSGFRLSPIGSFRNSSCYCRHRCPLVCWRSAGMASASVLMQGDVMWLVAPGQGACQSNALLSPAPTPTQAPHAYWHEGAVVH